MVPADVLVIPNLPLPRMPAPVIGQELTSTDAASCPDTVLFPSGASESTPCPAPPLGTGARVALSEAPPPTNRLPAVRTTPTVGDASLRLSPDLSETGTIPPTI